MVRRSATLRYDMAGPPFSQCGAGAFGRVSWCDILSNV